MITTVSNSDALWAAIKAAHAGDTILLAPGSYSALSLSNFKFNKGVVTIQSADPSHMAVINGLTLTNSTGFAFNHLDFATTSGTAANVQGSTNISFDASKFHGSVVGTGNGMIIRDSSGVSVTHSDMGTLGTGINELNSSNVTITGNVFHDISSGAIRGTTTTYETISGNQFVDAKSTVTDHSDVINLWQDNTANHVTITNNTYGATTTTTTTTPPPTTTTTTPPPTTTTPPPTTTTGVHTVTVTTADGLVAALKTAHAGDTIQLAAGTYNAVALSGFNFTGNVIIQSADNAHQAVINGLTVTNASGLAFNHLDFATNSGTAINVQSATNISFDSVTDHGTVAGTGNGMIIRDSSGVSFTNSNMGTLGTGINELNSSNITVTGNVFHDISGNAIRGTGATNEVISGNQFQEANPTIADHSDAIYLWQDNTANNVTITNNTYGTTSTTTDTASSSTTTSTSTPPPTTVTTPPPTTVQAPTSGQTVTVTTTDGLMAALKTAHAGDTIKLAAGNYSAVSVYGMHFDGTVTIQSADAAHQAVINGVSFSNTSGLALSNVNLTVPGSGSIGVSVMNSSNISLSGLTVYGTSGTDDGVGASIRYSTGVTLTGSDFSKLGAAIGMQASDDVSVSHNNLHDIQTDGILSGGSSHVVIEANSFTDFHPAVGDHPDAIQLFADGTTEGSDITIRDNVITRGSGDAIQGIFVESTNNLLVTGNSMIGTAYNGISISSSQTVLVENNFVQGYPDMGTRILTRGGSSDVTVVHNTAQQVGVYLDGGVALPNYFAGDNTIINATTSATDTSTLTSWLTQRADLTLVGTTSNNLLTGGQGDDTLDGSAGADTMAGGYGDDVYIADNAGDVVTEGLNAGVDTVKTSLATYTLGANVENLVLTGTGAQSGFGNSLNNTLTSNGVGATLNGGAGNDVLVSNGGVDTLTGGAGNDTFYFKKMPAGTVQITDFTHGQDVLDLHTILGGYQGTNPVTDQWLKFQSDASGTTVYVDADGPTGAAGFVAVAKLVGVTSISASDWVFH